MDLAMVNSFEEWAELYKKLVHWEIQLESIDDIGMIEILESQKNEANSQFFKFIEKNYQGWFHGEEKPVLSSVAIQAETQGVRRAPAFGVFVEPTKHGPAAASRPRHRKRALCGQGLVQRTVGNG